MKINEAVTEDDGKIIVKETHDVQSALDRAAALRSAGINGFSENRLVGTVPLVLLKEWAKEAGVKWDDREAMSELLKRKMLSGEFSKLRVWEGKY